MFRHPSHRHFVRIFTKLGLNHRPALIYEGQHEPVAHGAERHVDSVTQRARDVALSATDERTPAHAARSIYRAFTFWKMQDLNFPPLLPEVDDNRKRASEPKSDGRREWAIAGHVFS